MLRIALAFFVFVSFVLVISMHDVYGLIEIKKYKMINSEEVCDDKSCPKVTTENSKNKQADVKKQPYIQSKLSLKIEQKIIDDRRFLWFEGDGWHGLHNVQIKVFSDDFLTTFTSQTNSRGHLSVPWQIPQSMKPKIYDVLATDGINTLRTNLTINFDVAKRTPSSGASKCTSTKTPIDWSDCNLYGRVLKNVDLRYANLRKANLIGATLTNMDLTGADFSYAILKKSNLDGAILVGANLSYANLADTKIRNSDLTSATIRNANLVDADLTHSNLSYVDFRNSILTSSILAFTDLRGANLNATGMWDTNLNHCINHPVCEK
jgi:hypothetical protein